MEKMMRDSSVKVGGSVKGVINTGDNSFINNSQLKDEDLTDILADILSQLAQRYPNASEIEKQTVFQMEFRQKIQGNPTLKQRFLTAIKAGGFELTKVITNNPFVSVPLETVKGWIEAKSS